MAEKEKKIWDAIGVEQVSMIKVCSYHDDIQTMLGKKLEGELAQGGAAMRFNYYQFSSLPDRVCQIIMDAVTTGAPKGAGGCLIGLERLGGKIDTPDDGADAMAYDTRGALFWVSVIGVYSPAGGKPTPDGVQAVDAWMAKLNAEFAHCVVFQGGNGIEPRGVKASTMAKLQAIKGKYDPENTFSAVESGFKFMYNVKPAGST